MTFGFAEQGSFEIPHTYPHTRSDNFMGEERGQCIIDGEQWGVICIILCDNTVLCMLFLLVQVISPVHPVHAGGNFRFIASVGITGIPWIGLKTVFISLGS